MNRSVISFRRQACCLLALLVVLLALPGSAPAEALPHRIALPVVATPPGILRVGDEAAMRAAIASANDADQMPFIELTADIAVSAPLPPLDNPGASAATIQGNGHSLRGRPLGTSLGIGPALRIGPGTVVIIDQLTIFGGGQPEGEAFCGGGLFVEGHLTLRRSIVRDNYAERGGGICVLGQGRHASLLVEDSRITDNDAHFGAGIYAAAEEGGSIIVTVVNSTLAHNRAFNGEGGGLYQWASNNAYAFTTLLRSTISRNAALSGAGVYNIGLESQTEPAYAMLVVRNATLSGNMAEQRGGGIANHRIPYWEPDDDPTQPQVPPLGFGSVEIFNSTIAGNTAAQGSGIFNHGYALAEMTGTIVADNWPGGGDCWGAIDSQGYNLIGDGSCPDRMPTDLLEAEADLLALAVYAPGQTATHALGPASAARDHIPTGGPGCDPATDTDQRGVPRPQPAGGRCDVGAFEAAE